MQSLRAFFNSVSPLSEKTWQLISPLFKERFLKRGEVFIDAGVYARKIAFLKSGVVRGFYRNSEGATYNKHFFLNPSFIGGYASLITEKPNQIIQDALTDCEIMEIDFKRMTSYYDECPDLERIARKLAETFFVQKEQREVDLVMLHADERYEKFLKDYPNLEQLIPQYHIASYLGVTPTQLSRIRKIRSTS